VSTPDAPKIVEQIFTLACVHLGVPRAAKSSGVMSGGIAPLWRTAAQAAFCLGRVGKTTRSAKKLL
jgi:hypothetical protein